MWNLEKTSPTDEVNWNWVNTNLRKPRNTFVRKAEEKLITLDNKESPEEKAKVKASEDVRRAKIELASFEGVLKAEVEGLEQVMTETTIWLRDNHTAVSTSAEEIQQRLSRQHIEIGGRYMELRETGQVTA